MNQFEETAAQKRATFCCPIHFDEQFIWFLASKYYRIYYLFF